MQEENISLRAWVTLFILSLVWGSSFILIKKSLIAFDPLQLAAMRIFFSALALSPLLYYKRKEIEWHRWPVFLLLGTTGNLIPAVLFFYAQTQISSTLSGLLNSLTPIWTMIVGLVFFGAVFNRLRLIGVILGFLGAATLVLLSGKHPDNPNVWYGSLVVLATLSYGVSGNVVKTRFQDTPSKLISAGSFATVAIPSFFYLIYSGFFTSDFTAPEVQYSLIALLVLALVGTAIATIVFYKLVQETNAVFGSSVAYLMPVVAIGWGILDGEYFSWTHLIGMALILSGVNLIRRAK